MHFDPAIAAQQALLQAQKSGELGDLEAEILEAEDEFSTDQGAAAKKAFHTLQDLGMKLPHARYFQEFLIFITWQQVTEGPLAQYFQQGLRLCGQFLERFGKDIDGTATQQQILAIQESFRGGLGLEEEQAIPEFDEDAFQGGD